MNVRGQSAVSNHIIRLPVSDGTKPFLTRVIREFLDRWKSDICHEAATGMGPGDEGEMIESGH